MKKKLLGIMLVVVLTGLFFLIGSGVILMLAPGTEVFGVRYIASGRSKCHDIENLSTQQAENIYIKTYGVPITINYTDYYAAQVGFTQNFVGFTKSGYEKATLSVSQAENGDIYIETKEMVKWLYALNSEADYKLVLFLPKVYAMDKSLFISSEASDLTINGGATYKTFSMVSSGELTTTNGKILADEFKYHTSKMINVGEEIVSTNYDLKSTGSSINIRSATTGNIVAETKSGDVKFVSCQSLTVTTGSGNIKTYGSGLNSVAKGVTIKTRGGDISLGNISAEDESSVCNISSVSGSVSIANMKDGNINADRGKVKIDSSRSIVINSKIGEVLVDEATQKVVVNGRNGNVSLGGDGNVSNVAVYTTTGNIDAKNTLGTVELKSESGVVKLKNAESENITLISGRGLTAEKLKGEVYAKSNGDINLSFIGITGNVTVDAGSKANNVSVNAGETSYLDVDYKITSTKGKIAKVYVDEDVIAENSKIDSGTREGRCKILINTSYAKVVLKLTI